MPRIYTSANDPLDFCWECFPDEASAEEEFGDVGDGPDGRGNCFAWDADHPNYDECDYHCHDCKESLETEDNEPVHGDHA